jgi:hypothetical protein
MLSWLDSHHARAEICADAVWQANNSVMIQVIIFAKTDILLYSINLTTPLAHVFQNETKEVDCFWFRYPTHADVNHAVSLVPSLGAQIDKHIVSDTSEA